MMSKKEWITYFEATKGRKPTPLELQEAIKQGIISNPSRLFGVKRKNVLIIISLVIVTLAIILIFVRTSEETPHSVTSQSFSIYSFSTTEASNTSSLGTSTSSSSSSMSDSENHMNLEAIAKGDYSSVSGTWVSENGEVFDPSVGKNNFTSSAYKMIDGSLSRSLDYQEQSAGSGGVSFVPVGIAANVSDAQLGIEIPTDTSVERIIVGGLNTVVYYRQSDVDKIKTSSSSVELYRAISKRIASYRTDVNDSFKTRTDQIADNFTSTSNSYYLEMKDYIINQSAKDAIKSYQTKTDSITDIQQNGDTVTFTLYYTTTISYTDGRADITQSNQRNYVMKKINGEYRIERF